MGLVNAVVPPAELLPYTYSYVRTLITNVFPGSLRKTKRQIYSDLHRDVRSAMRVARSPAPNTTTSTETRLTRAEYRRSRPLRLRAGGRQRLATAPARR